MIYLRFTLGFPIALVGAVAYFIYACVLVGWCAMRDALDGLMEIE